MLMGMLNGAVGGTEVAPRHVRWAEERAASLNVLVMEALGASLPKRLWYVRIWSTARG